MNAAVGAGHMMRCLAIADAARSMGEETVFLLADTQALDLLSEKGYGWILLNTLWNRMDAELPVLRKIIREKKITRLLVDSYQVTEHYFRQLQKETQVCYIDDLYAFPYPVNQLICYEIYHRCFPYEENYDSGSLLLGTEYVPLKKEFYHCKKKEIRKQAECLLLLSGGMAAYELSDQLLEQLDWQAYREIHVVCGRSYEAYEKLRQKYGHATQIRLHTFVADLDVLMKRADLAVSAGGVTIYELCACGTPTVSYAHADNQLMTVHKFAEDKIIDYAGDIRTDAVTDRILKYLAAYRTDQQLRQERSRKMQALTDGKGALRVARVLMQKEGGTK